jgi:TRAP-type C4-dicarboxylate transport system permease large subunit
MTIFIKTIIVVLLLFIVFALGSALYYLMTDKGDSERIVKALTWRIGLSLLLFVLLMVSFMMGWLTPNSI